MTQPVNMNYIPSKIEIQIVNSNDSSACKILSKLSLINLGNRPSVGFSSMNEFGTLGATVPTTENVFPVFLPPNNTMVPKQLVCERRIHYLTTTIMTYHCIHQVSSSLNRNRQLHILVLVLNSY
jgi:hypothetical protein